MSVSSTPIYGLKKPDDSEFYDIGVHNSNMDVIEEELGMLNENMAPLDSPSFTGVPKIAGSAIATTESGKWTPTIDPTAVVRIEDARYSLIGNRIFIRARIIIDTIGTKTGVLQILGLPELPISTQNSPSVEFINTVEQIHIAFASVYSSGSMAFSIQPVSYDNYRTMQFSDLKNGSQILLDFSYLI